MSRSEPRLELGVHVFGIMWNYFGIHCLLLRNESGSRSRCARFSSRFASRVMLYESPQKGT